MNIQSTNGKNVLKTRGYNFQHIFVFDGLPQFFPTNTSGYDKGIGTSNTFQSNFTYIGHDIKEFGNSCRGPLPNNSILKDINIMSRNRFIDLGLNIKWYGRTWEFTNMFWWQVKM